MAKRNSLQDAKKEMWISRIRELEAQLAEARRDGARLEWLESQCVFQMAVPQFWRNRNGKISFAPYDEAKLVEGENVRAAIDAAMKEAK